jgi:hypothetical protein
LQAKPLEDEKIVQIIAALEAINRKQKID